MMKDSGEYEQVRSSDGVRLCVRTRGPQEAPAILFIHGFSQSHLAWRRQFDDELADEFRLVAYDLRGHGWSDKPDDAQAYSESRRWADDVAAVLDALDLRRAVLVGWSYGGRIILDYVAAYGTGRIAGINFVAAVIGDDKTFYGAQIGTIRETMDRDPAASIDGTRRFLRACFAAEPERDEFERMLAYNAMVPASIRAKLGRKLDDGAALARLNVPVLFTHGTLDAIIAPAMSRYGLQAVPNAGISHYEGVGHAPFYEDAARFNRELADFVRTCAG